MWCLSQCLLFKYIIINFDGYFSDNWRLSSSNCYSDAGYKNFSKQERGWSVLQDSIAVFNCLHHTLF